ncbi:MAG: Vps62-related protein [Dehalococcoidales bacterium]|nr:Vps62-related protein [Dehalococcoidales bacterium]
MKKIAKFFLHGTLLTSLILSLLTTSCGSRQPSVVSPPIDVDHWLSTYSPVLYLHQSENFSPKSIESMLRQSDLMMGTVNKTAAPLTTAKLMKYNAAKYLLNMRNAGPLKCPDTLLFSLYNNTVYARLTTAPPNYYVMQYWFFYPYDNWHQVIKQSVGVIQGEGHEGDWEMITVVVDNISGQIVRAGYAQHFSGYTYLPGELQIQNGTHPVVYVARGSHANYATTGRQDTLSLFGIEVPTSVLGYGDYTANTGTVLSNSSSYLLINITNELGWTGWKGKWGDGGVPSPANQGEKWDDPLKWSENPKVAYFIGGTESPVHLHAYDRLGNHVGLNSKNGTDLDIPGAYMYLPSDGGNESIVIATEENLRFEIKATDAGHFNFWLRRYIKSNNSTIMARYENVTITKNTTAVLDTQNNPTYVMKVDYGNGTSKNISANISPKIVAMAPTIITPTSVRLNGALASLGTANNATVSFEWGSTSSYGNNTTPNVIAATGSFSADIDNLSANTSYHFRIKAIGSGITVFGEDQWFTTPAGTASNPRVFGPALLGP